MRLLARTVYYGYWLPRGGGEASVSWGRETEFEP